MKQISCNVARDLMALCAGEMASDDSRKLLEDHLAGCPGCSGEFERLKREMDMPVDTALQTRSRDAFIKFGARLRRQRVMAACIGVLAMLVAVIVCCMVYQHVVGVVHDFFSPSEVVIARDAVSADGWQTFGAGDSTLEFDSIFWNGEVTSHTDSDGTVELRFLDEHGNVCLEGIKVEPGTTVRLDGLERNEVYEIEYRAEGRFFYLTFH